MWKVYDAVANRFTGAIGEIQAIKDSGLFAGKLKVRYQNGEVYHVDPDHLVDPKFSTEIIRANRQKRSPCLEDSPVALDPIADFDVPVFADVR
jgi:hypothetical protein